MVKGVGDESAERRLADRSEEEVATLLEHGVQRAREAVDGHPADRSHRATRAARRRRERVDGSLEEEGYAHDEELGGHEEEQGRDDADLGAGNAAVGPEVAQHEPQPDRARRLARIRRAIWQARRLDWRGVGRRVEPRARCGASRGGGRSGDDQLRQQPRRPAHAARHRKRREQRRGAQLAPHHLGLGDGHRDRLAIQLWAPSANWAPEISRTGDHQRRRN